MEEKSEWIPDRSVGPQFGCLRASPFSFASGIARALSLSSLRHCSHPRCSLFFFCMVLFVLLRTHPVYGNLPLARLLSASCPCCCFWQCLSLHLLLFLAQPPPNPSAMVIAVYLTRIRLVSRERERTDLRCCRNLIVYDTALPKVYSNEHCCILLHVCPECCILQSDHSSNQSRHSGTANMEMTRC